METIRENGKLNSNKMLAMMVFMGLAFMLSPQKQHPLTLENDSRVVHTHELLGSNYRKTEASQSTTALDLQHFIYVQTKQRLKAVHKDLAWPIAQAIWAESQAYSLDPLFLMAVIENESNFNPDALGSAGEIGLMQLKPKTAEWISRKFGVSGWKGRDTLKNVGMNIKLGAVYLSYLKKRFSSKGNLYLAAYNMGTGSLNRAVKANKVKTLYPKRVMGFYVRFHRALNQGPDSVLAQAR